MKNKRTNWQTKKYSDKKVIAKMAENASNSRLFRLAYLWLNQTQDSKKRKVFPEKRYYDSEGNLVLSIFDVARFILNKTPKNSI